MLELLPALHFRRKQAPSLSSKEVSEIFFIPPPSVSCAYFLRAANKNLRSSLGKVISNHTYEVCRTGNFIVTIVTMSVPDKVSSSHAIAHGAISRRKRVFRTLHGSTEIAKKGQRLGALL